ncbi:MAG TPA: formate dehydrogenase subunit gamma [Nitrospiraceae bacterium]|jgi:formate dehydrogenase subunit gamma|nr:formate dehydrogenase subunit gamma [Nitrospiraceae bacterium]
MARLIRKASAFEILNHWVMAISCIVLAVQGYGFLFHIEGIGSFFGGFNTMRTLHNYFGIAFSVALFFSIFLYLKESLTFDADDIRWIAVFGGYLSHNAKTPPMGKINTGQKFFYLAVLVLGIGIAGSGFAIWLLSGDKQLVMYSHLIHNVSFVILMIAVAAHIYLGTFANPGTFRIMVYGTVPYDWARKRHPKWVAEVEGHKHKA